MSEITIGALTYDPEEIILDAVKNGRTQKDVAEAYVWGLDEIAINYVDWRKVNTAIIDRWSSAGLEKVKKMAWKLKDKEWRK